MPKNIPYSYSAVCVIVKLKTLITQILKVNMKHTSFSMRQTLHNIYLRCFSPSFYAPLSCYFCKNKIRLLILLVYSTMPYTRIRTLFYYFQAVNRRFTREQMEMVACPKTKCLEFTVVQCISEQIFVSYNRNRVSF